MSILLFASNSRIVQSVTLATKLRKYFFWIPFLIVSTDPIISRLMEFGNSAAKIFFLSLLFSLYLCILCRNSLDPVAALETKLTANHSRKDTTPTPIKDPTKRKIVIPALSTNILINTHTPILQHTIK